MRARSISGHEPQWVDLVNMQEPTYFSNYQVPGHDLLVSSVLMTDPSSTRFVLEEVLRRCGKEAAIETAYEIRRRLEERQRTVSTFVLTYAVNKSVDAAINAVLTDGN